MSSAVLTIVSLSISGSIIALTILALRPLLRHKVSKAFFYYIWIVVLLRLVLPFSPSANAMVVLFAKTQPATATIPYETTAGQTTSSASAADSTGITIDGQTLYTPTDTPVGTSTENNQEDVWAPLGSSLIWVWLVGACVYLLCYIIPYLRFAREVKKSSIPPLQEYNNIFNRLSSSQRVRLMQCDYIRTPMLVGVFRPCIIVPRLAFAQNDPEEKMTHILRHELIHYRRKDLIYKWVTVCISALHWFNPLMFLVQREISRACELACDEGAMSGMDANERRQYGETLLSLAATHRMPAGILTTTMCEDKASLKERLIGIMKFKKHTASAAALSVVLVLLLAGCATGLGSAQQSGTEIVTPPPTTEIESIAGTAPIDLADNDISHAFLPYLVLEAKRIYPDLEITNPGPYQEPYKVFAAVPFKDGALLLAGTAVSQDYPVLYYMVGENVVAVNDDAEYFSSNYTVFQGCTIAYGRMLGEYTTNPFIYATGVKATFANGQETSVQSFVPDTLPDTAGGYILVADGETWLSSLDFYNSDGTLLTDMTHTVEFGWNKESWLYRSTDAEIFNLQHLTQFSTVDLQPAEAYAAIPDNGASAQMIAFYDDGMDISYLWRNNNILHQMMQCAAGSALRVASYPPLAEWKDVSERSDGTPLPTDAQISWFDLSNEVGTVKDYASLLVPGDLETPDKAGQYLLIIRDSGWWFVLAVQVV